MSGEEPILFFQEVNFLSVTFKNYSRIVRPLRPYNTAMQPNCSHLVIQMVDDDTKLSRHIK